MSADEKVDLGSVSVRRKNKALAAAAVELLEAERPMTLRQLYYRLVSAGYLRPAQKEYKRLGTLMTRIREAGAIPRTWLVDHVRATLKPSSWTGLGVFIDRVRDSYRKDFWASMPHHVEVFVEKDAVAGTVQPVTEQNDVALHVCRGYASLSFAGELADLWKRVRKPIFAYYLGDFDPSGFDLERDLREKLTRYSGRRYEPNPARVTERSFGWQRLGVLPEDFETLDLLRLPVKRSDCRAASFVDQYGDDCAEIDAIAPSELRQRVLDAIDSHIDVERWNLLLKVESLEQETLNQFCESLGQ